MNFYLVTFQLQNGKTATVTAMAPNKSEAEYRGAYKCENLYGCVSHTIACRKAG